MLQLLLFFTLHLRTRTIDHKSLQQRSSNSQRVFIQDWLNSFWIACHLHTRLNSNWTSRVFLTHDWLNSNWITVACCVLPFISHDQQSDECTWRRMFLPSRNLYKCKQAAGIVVVACFYPFFILHFVVGGLFICLSSIFILHFVAACLFLCPFIFFNTDVVAIFLFLS